MNNWKRKIGFILMIGIVFLINFCACEKEAVEEIVIETSDNDEGDSQEESNEIEKQFICVHVCGAVKEPGVYELEEGSRVADAIEAAGGLLEDTPQESLNFARILADGEQVLVLDHKEMQEQMQNMAIAADGCVNINISGVEELMTLSGIGETRARAILAYREEHGNFQKIEDICNVDGIGESTYEKIKDKITVN